MIRFNGITIDRKKCTIEHRGIVHKLVRSRFDKVCYFILGGGVSLEMAFWRFYGDDPDGGPEKGFHIFNVHLKHWQDQFLTRLQLEWRSHKIAGVSFYEIVPIFQLPDPKRFSFMRGQHKAGKPINSRGKNGGLNSGRNLASADRQRGRAHDADREMEGTG